MNFRHLPVYRNQIKCVQRYGTCKPPRFPVISWHMSELPTKFGSYQKVLWREGKLFRIIRNLLQWFQTLWRHRFACCCCCHLEKRLSTEIWRDINRNIKRLQHYKESEPGVRIHFFYLNSPAINFKPQIRNLSHPAFGCQTVCLGVETYWGLVTMFYVNLLIIVGPVAQSV